MAKSKEALGRGLGALLGEIEEVYDNEVPKHHTILELPVSQVKPNPFQPRKNFDEKSLQELSESIKIHGLLQPVVVVEDIDGYILVAGERRLRATKLAKLKTIRAISVTIGEAQMRQHALIENIQRDELNIIDLANAYDELLKVHGITHDELSTMVHKSRAHITNTLRLLQLSKKAKTALTDGKISAGHAKVLVGLSDKEQQLMVDSIVGQKLSVRDVESMVKNMKGNAGPSRRGTVSETEGIDLTPIIEYLEDHGFRATASSKKVTISFDDGADAMALLKLFK